ncbi:MAG: ACP S-malonyltransferase [Chloroflexota bacterium]|nr:ACP S-malonyltransferase [Chloroflexota bacterium]MDE2941066.1 ACP S-malonyltransferase [Chloroflexota bacterium]MDE3267408.1 ACP S-malonyltransferase [Chloroflexota bacterium]
MASSTSGPTVAFLFPGQGSQAVGMGLDLYRESPAAKAVIDEVDEALGVSLSSIIFEGPEDELRRTVNAQPGIMAVSLACLRAMEETLGASKMPSPSLVAGHSLGEYTALVAAGALSASDGVRLVRERGRLMQSAADMSDGGMAAILGMEDADLADICRETDTEISNMNTPDQTVISGARAAVERAMELANERGARRTVALPVAGAFHSRLMQPAQEGLAAAVAGVALSNAATPIVANCTGAPISTAGEIRTELTTGLCSCVRWRDCVQHMLQSGVNVFYEIGPGRVLAGMVKRIEPDAEVFNVGDVEGLQQLAESLGA